MTTTEPDAPKRSYHDLHITTPTIARTAISGLPFGVEVICNRVGGWQVWQYAESGFGRLLGTEYGVTETHWLVLDVAGHVIVDSRGRSNQNDDDPDTAPPARRLGVDLRNGG